MLWLTRLWLRSNPGQYQGIHRGKRKLWDVDQAINLHGLRIDHLQVRRLPLGKIACQSDQHPLAYSPQTLFQQRPNVARAGQVQHTIEIALTLEHGHNTVVFRLRLGRALVFECKQKLAATQRKCNDCVVVLRVLDVDQFVAAPDLHFVLPRNQRVTSQQIEVNLVDTQRMRDSYAVHADVRPCLRTVVRRADILDKVDQAGRSDREYGIAMRHRKRMSCDEAVVLQALHSPPERAPAQLVSAVP